MSLPNKTLDKLKSKVSLRLVDPLGAGIAELKFQVKTAEHKIVAKGMTDAEGKIPTFVAELGALLMLHVQRFGTEEMKLVKTLIPWSEDFRFKIVSGKRKDKVVPKEHEGSPGPYKRKTYEVRDGDTLSGIAVAHRTTAAALAALNGIKVTDIIRSGQILKVPNDPDSQPAAAPVAPSSSPQPDPSPATPAEDPAALNKKEDASGDTDSGTEPADAHNAPAVPPVAPNTAKPGAQADNTTSAPNTAPVKTKTEDARGENGTPKTSVKPTCDQAGCIKRGDEGPIVEELNIRLMGFGNTIAAPAGLHQFTAATEKALSQFQRDYMGVAETGRACRSVLAALDDFAKKFPIAFKEFACQCQINKPCTHPCNGFGLSRPGSASVGHKRQGQNVAVAEKPGIHRALFWSLRAAIFYLSGMEHQLGYKYWKVNSGYRCWERAKQMDTFTFNHLGNAADVQFKYASNGSKVSGPEHMKTIRDKVFLAKLRASPDWRLPNRISIEPIEGKPTKDGHPGKPLTPTWIHMDVRMFEAQYVTDRFYAKTLEASEGEPMLTMAKNEGRFALINCGGGIVDPVKPIASPGPTQAPKPRAPSRAPAALPPLSPAALPKHGSYANCGEGPIDGPPSEKRKPADTLSVSQLGLDFIRVWESGNLTKQHLKPYDDNKHYCTIGVGHLIDGKTSCAALRQRGSKLYKEYEAGITPEQENALFAEDVQRIVSTMLLSIHVPLHQHEFDALAALAYNTGGLNNFNKLLAALNKGEYSKCCDEFKDITNHGDPGLVKRRQGEMRIFRNNVYDARH